MKKQENVPVKNIVNRKSFLEWKKRRDVILKSIPVEVDLENREIIFHKDLPAELNFQIPTNNVDQLINDFVDPTDFEKVKTSLLKAEKGLEEPIKFNFIHPKTEQKLSFEYRYEIVYVKYSSTKLNGFLVNLRERRLKKH